MADSYRNNYQSNRVHPQDVRSSQWSRSPERVGRNDSRYEGDRGERSGDQGRNYDYYRSGQPALRDIPPIRANGSPLHFPTTHPLIDSRHPRNGYSSSNSSPNHPRDTSRLSAKTSLEKSRKETVINIKGLAAQEDRETTPATESMGGKLGNLQEEAPKARTPQDSAERTVASVSQSTRSSPGVSPVTQHKPTVVLTNIISDALKHLINEITDMSSLKTKEKHAKTALEKRTAEYEKTKPNHEKFPPMREAQTLAKREAEKGFHAASERVKQKDILLAQMAARTAEQVVPAIIKSIGGPTAHEQEKMQGRIASLEKTCEDFQNLFNDQKNFWETKQKADQTAQEGLKKKLDELQTASQKDQVSWNQEKASLKTQLNDINVAVNNINMRQDKVDEAVAHIPSMKTDINEVRTQSVNNMQFERLKILLASVYADIAQLEKRADTQDSHLNALDIDSNSHTQTTATIKKTLKEIETTFKTLSNEHESLVGAVNSSKNKLSVFESKLADRSPLNELQGRMSLIEKPLSLIPNPEAASTSLAVNSRIKALEEQTMSMSTQLNQLAGLKEDITLKINPGMDALQSEMNLFKDKLNVIEQKACSMQYAITGLEAKVEGMPDILQVEDRLKKLADCFGSLKPIQDSTESLLSTLEQRQVSGPADPVLSVTAINSNEAMNAPSNSSSVLGRSKEILDVAKNQEFSHDSVLKLKLDALEDKYNAKFQEVVATLLNETGTSVRELVIEEVVREEIKLSGIASRLDAVEASARNLKASQETVDGSYVFLKTSYESLKASLDNMEAAVTKQDLEISNAKNNMVGATAAAAVRMIQQQSLFAPRSIEQKLIDDMEKVAHNVATSLVPTIEANTEAIGSLQSRVDNINTKDLHSAIVQTMLEQYPNIQDMQLKLSHVKASQLTSEANMQMLKLELQEVQERSQRIHEIKADNSALEACQKEFRKEIDTTKEKVFSLAKQTDKQVRDLSTEFAETNEKMIELAESVEKLRHRVAETENTKKVDRLSNQLPQPSRTASCAPISRTTFGIPTSRQASVSSESGITLKRKLANGSSSSAQNGGSSARNAVSNGVTPETIFESPAKRTRQSNGADYSAKDLSCEPENDDVHQTVTGFTANDDGDKE
ncbi:hypothetical protein BUE80_DR005445 [Diplocarpon rosae]|nr:hypothetical protein BUE80_DR005445 [Diplocarpon rosae]